MTSFNNIPKDGLLGLKENWQADAKSGFLVFLLALPLSLGIAKASGFPAAMGVLTAMVGGMCVCFFAGSALTIKGPAAGLITICAGAVTELGALNIEGQTGIQLACGAIVVMAFFQILFGFLKFGSLSDFFPPSAVHGMLAAIGLIIFSKQIHVLLGIDPATLKGLEPIELYERIPHSFMNADIRVTFVGIVSLIIIFGMPLIKNQFAKKLPAPMVVLLITIPMALIMDFKNTKPAFDLVSIGNFWENIKFNASFAAIDTGVFWKYVLMFLFINSLESLLTVKAIDGLDPYKRESNFNKDLYAVGVGNALSGLLGGLPMISEVARSSANINFGGRTRWANFFHGLFLFIAMLLFIPVIELIPNSSLAALLIAVGYRLASPKEFFKTYKIGPEQFAIFVITIIVTISTDLLIGVGVGIFCKLLFHVLSGAPLKGLFHARYELSESGDEYHIIIKEAAIFSNLIAFKKLFKKLKPRKKVFMNFSEARIVDHSFLEQLHHFSEEYQHHGGSVSIIGFEFFQTISSHPLATRKNSNSNQVKNEIKLTSRQIALQKFAAKNEYMYHPQRVINKIKYKGFPIQHGNTFLFEENILIKYTKIGRLEVSDIYLQEISIHNSIESSITIIQLSEIGIQIPDFALESESLLSKLFESISGKDIDFRNYPNFSKKYYLRSNQESEVIRFFTPAIVSFLENRESLHIECYHNRLIFYKKRQLANLTEIVDLEKFINEFAQVLLLSK